MEFKRGIDTTVDMKGALHALEHKQQVKVNDLRALDQLCIGKTAEQLKAMAKAIRKWRLKVREEETVLERARYRSGDEVSFRTKSNVRITGIVKSVNKQTLSLHKCSDGGGWKVAYCFIEKIT